MITAPGAGIIQLTSADISAWIGAYMWPFMRIGAMLGIAPIFGARMVPKRIRVALAVALTFVLVPVIPAAPAVDPLSGAGLLISAQQMLIGLAMGFALQMVFGALVLGGQVAAMSMGLGFASMVDPQNGIQVPVVSQYYLVLATLLFLGLNGHLALLEVLAESFRTLPVGMTGLSGDGTWMLLGWAGEMFGHAVLVALPACAALMLVNIAFGVVTRAAPTMNIFSVGFPVTMLMGFFIILATLPAITPRLTQMMVSVFGMLHTVLAGGGA